MNPPIVYELTNPSSHKIIRTTAIVYSMMISSFFYEFINGSRDAILILLGSQTERGDSEVTPF